MREEQPLRGRVLCGFVSGEAVDKRSSSESAGPQSEFFSDGAQKRRQRSKVE